MLHCGLGGISLTTHPPAAAVVLDILDGWGLGGTKGFRDVELKCPAKEPS